MRVEWRMFLTTLGVVFLSEMGDKTQITTLLLAGAKPQYILWVGLGSAMALICTSFIEVIVGSQILARLLQPKTIELLSALAFMVLGVLLLTGVMGNIQVKV